MGRGPTRAELRGLVRDVILQYLSENPDATYESALPAIRDRLKSDFRFSPFLLVLLQLAAVLLPLILRLFNKDVPDDA